MVKIKEKKNDNNTLYLQIITRYITNQLLFRLRLRFRCYEFSVISS